MGKRRKNRNSLRITFLGGLEEIGRNMSVIEDKTGFIIIDCGLMFPEDEMFGVDLVIPDLSYVLKNKHKALGVIITHGHEDHIGALPYLLQELKIPVYGTKLTMGLVRSKLEEYPFYKQIQLNNVDYREKVKLGNFSFELIRTNHSISDSAAIALETQLGTIIHTGDFKIDNSPIDGKPFDYYRFGELGEKGVLLLLSDSTNAERDGHSGSESYIGTALREAIENSKGRVIVATFSSNIQRIQQVINIAKELNKKIAISGRSLEKTIGISYELGYLDIPDGLIFPIEEVKSKPREKTIILSTGTQGEPLSALTLISKKRHKWIRIEKGDTVVISASIVPGNEKVVSRNINNLFKIGAEVIYEAFEDIHVSGHACKDELKTMINLVKPEFFIPIHGEYKHLYHHSKLANSLGIPESNILVAQNGDMLELTTKTLRKLDNLNVQPIFVDGKSVGDISNTVLKDRQILSDDGIVIAILVLDLETRHLICDPEIITRGFVYVKESSELLGNTKKLVKKNIENLLKKEPDVRKMKHKIKSILQSFFYRMTERNPMILIRAIELDKNKISHKYEAKIIDIDEKNK